MKKKDTHFTIYASEIKQYRTDSERALSAYRIRKMLSKTWYKAAVNIGAALYLLRRIFGRQAGLFLAASMSAVLLASTSIT